MDKLTRRELYDLVWSEPLTVVAKKLETTDSFLRTICKKLNIPLPKMGYWMKIKFGKPVFNEPFQEIIDGPNELKLGNENPETDNSIIVFAEPSPITARKLEIENDKNVSLVVPNRLVNPDKLIVSAKEKLSQTHGNSREGNRLRIWDALKIVVTKENISRALRFMDTFIKAIKARGHDIEIRDRETNVIIYGERITVSCREKAKRITLSDRTYNYTELRSTGLLSFNIEGFYTKEWKDGKLKLEDQLSMILAKLELEGQKLQTERKEREKRWAEEARQKKVLEDIQKAKEKQLEDFKLLMRNSKKFKEVVTIREYIAAVEEKAVASGHLTEDLKLWIQWAQNKANWYDPFLDQPDPDLEGVHKDTLTFKKSLILKILLLVCNY